jgi:hypothetical protein
VDRVERREVERREVERREVERREVERREVERRYNEVLCWIEMWNKIDRGLLRPPLASVLPLMCRRTHALFQVPPWHHGPVHDLGRPSLSQVSYNPLFPSFPLFSVVGSLTSYSECVERKHCAHCHGPIEDTVLTALGKVLDLSILFFFSSRPPLHSLFLLQTWHTRCFKCIQCGKELGREFIAKDGHGQCVNCSERV